MREKVTKGASRQWSATHVFSWSMKNLQSMSALSIAFAFSSRGRESITSTTGACTQSEAIGRNRAQSDAIGSNRTQSEAIGRTQKQSTAISRNQPQSAAISHTQKHSEALGCNWTQLDAI